MDLAALALPHLVVGGHLAAGHDIPQDQSAGLEHVGGGGLVHSAAKVALELTGDHLGKLGLGIFSHNSSSCNGFRF